MKNPIDFDLVLSLVDKALNPTYLSPTQEIVLREVWNGKTYSEMAYDYNYDPEYIKGVGCNLWKTLSQAFDDQISKSNFVPFIRQKLSQQLEQGSTAQVSSVSLSEDLQITKGYWTTAPNVKHFIGRESEIATLQNWVQEPDCRCVIISGMVGSGKTALATKFAQEVQHQFDYVVWFSLLQTPSLKTLLNRYLKLIDSNYKQEQKSESGELSSLLSRFIDCLKQRKILLIIDGLQSILQCNQANISYKTELEEYGQLLRSIISTNHQSILITTSRIKPKLLEYYSKNQVKFLDLKGFDEQTAQQFVTSQAHIQPQESQISHLVNILQGNPQLFKIVQNHLESLIENDCSEQIVQDISLLEEVKKLLELELSYASNLEKEIIYWLVVSCSAISFKQLSLYSYQSQRKLEFSQSISHLVKRSLVIEQNRKYSLMPLMKVYLQRKLVQQALFNHSQPTVNHETA